MQWNWPAFLQVKNATTIKVDDFLFIRFFVQLGYELEALMVAHDGVTSTLPAVDSTTIPTACLPLSASVEKTLANNIAPQSLLANAAVDHRFGDDNIKIIKIEKSTEPLGATVRNEGDAVVIGR